MFPAFGLGVLFVTSETCDVRLCDWLNETSLFTSRTQQIINSDDVTHKDHGLDHQPQISPHVSDSCDQMIQASLVINEPTD